MERADQERFVNAWYQTLCFGRLLDVVRTRAHLFGDEPESIVQQALLQIIASDQTFAEGDDAAAIGDRVLRGMIANQKRLKPTGKTDGLPKTESGDEIVPVSGNPERENMKAQRAALKASIFVEAFADLEAKGGEVAMRAVGVGKQMQAGVDSIADLARALGITEAQVKKAREALVEALRVVCKRRGQDIDALRGEP